MIYLVSAADGCSLASGGSVEDGRAVWGIRSEGCGGGAMEVLKTEEEMLWKCDERKSVDVITDGSGRWREGKGDKRM